MATVKTTGTGATLRILTKTSDGVQRVSCSCCEEAICCMYPADQLGIGYTQDDLPDTIDVAGLILGVITRIIVPRNGSQYGPFNQSTSGGITFTDTLLVDLNVSGLLAWLFNDDLTGQTCLFLADNSEEYAIEDTFEDAYEVTGPVSGTVTRQSRCAWSGTGLTLSNFGYQWKVNGRDKSGNQNTPVGSYADGYSLSA